MERAVTFEEPQVLLELPKPFAERGRIQAGSAYNISSRRRRKRANIVVAVDGSTLNLYAANDTRLVTSHAFPPQTSFTAPPVFLHKRGIPGKAPTQRFACAAIKTSLGPASQQLCYFEEELNSNPSGVIELGATVKKETVDVGLKNDPIVYIDAVPVARKPEESIPPFDVVAITSSGSVQYRTGNLKQELWTGQLLPHQQSVRIEHAAMYDAAALDSGFLGAHPDIIAQLNGGGSSAQRVMIETYVLISISSSRPEGTATERFFVNVHVLSRPGAMDPGHSDLQHLKTWPLNLPVTEPPSESRSYNLDIKTGHLQASSGKDLVIHDLMRTIPEQISQFHAHDTDFNSALRLRGSLVVASVQRHVSVYDIRYRSLLARAETFRTNRSLKRKRTETASLSGPFRIFRYASGSSLLFGLTDTQLVSMRVNLRTTTAGTARVGRLADSLGQGVVSRPGHNKDGGEMSKIMARLSQASNKNDEFDRIFFSEVVENPDVSIHETHSICNFVVCKIFAWVSRDSKKRLDFQPPLRLARMPKESFHWLTFKGFVTPRTIEHALCQSPGYWASMPTVSAHDLVESLAQYDQSLELLSAWIDLQPHPELDTFVHALRRLLQRFDADDSGSEIKLMTDDREVEEGADDEMVEDAESAAERDLEAAATLLEDGMHIAAGAIRTCIARLSSSFQQGSLSTSFRNNMAQRDLILLIDLLRVELSEDGWMTRHLGLTPSADGRQVPSEGLVGTCLLLNSAIDALGSGGLLAGSYGVSDEFDNAEEFLVALRQETSAIIEGIQEATFFSGFLKDFLRFELTMAESTKRTPMTSDAAIRASTEDGMAMADKVIQDAILPLGLSSVKAISATRVGAGGEIQRRTGRDIRNKMSRRLGRYTFETIRI